MKFLATSLFMFMLALICKAQSNEPDLTVSDSIDFVSAVKLLESEHQVRFAFDHQLLSKKRIPVWDISRNFDEILSDIFEPLELLYERSDKTILIIPKSRYVEQNIALSGTIVDEATGESLPNATVYLTSTGKYTVTNREGRFSFLDVPTDTTVIEVRYLGYTPHKFVARQLDQQQNATINLSNETSVLNEITISEMKESIFEISQQASKTSVDMDAFKSMANYGEPDVFRSVQLLPGISGTNETSSGLNIRGGSPEQNLILFDGFTVYHLDHFFGIFSAFNSNVIKDVQLYKGGYGAEYGTRVSGVMDITGKSGNTHKPSGSIGVNLISSNAVIEVPITKKLSWLVAARRSYTDVLESGLYKKLFDHIRDNQPGSVSQSDGSGDDLDELAPDFYFYDANTKLSYKIDENNLLSFSYYNGRDNLKLQDTDEDFYREDFEDGFFYEQSQKYQYTESSKWGNRGGSIRYGRQWNDRLFTEVKVVGSKFFRNQNVKEILDYSLSFSVDSVTSEINADSTAFITIRDTVMIEESFDYNFRSENQVNESSVFVTSDYKFDDRNLFRFGLFSIKNSVRYQNYEDGNPSDDVLIDDIGFTTGIFAENTLSFNGHKSALTSGVRFSKYSPNGKFYVEPRLSFHHQLDNGVNLKAAFGRYNQFTVNTAFEDVSGAQASFWVLADDGDVPILKSNHYVLGATFKTDNLTIDVEGYYRSINGITNITNNQFFDENENVQQFLTGKGRGYGLEVLLKKQFGKHNTWIAYTLSKTEHKINGINNTNYFNSDQDQRHEIKWVNQMKLGKFDLTATWIYGSGRPYSPPDSVLVQIDENFELAFPVPNITSKNSLQLPAYHRLDLSAAYNARLGLTRLTFGVNLLNVYSRRNIRGYRYTLDFDSENGDGLSQKAIRLLSFTPSIFLNFNF